MKHEINLPRVYSSKFSLGKLIFSWAKVHSVTSTNVPDNAAIIEGVCSTDTTTTANIRGMKPFKCELFISNLIDNVVDSAHVYLKSDK